VWQTTEDKSRLLHFAALGFFFVAPLCCARACGARKESFLRFYGTTPQPLLPTTTPARENRACRGPLLRSRRANAQVVPYTCLNVDAKSLIVK
jgi:hypothetical protein